MDLPLKSRPRAEGFIQVGCVDDGQVQGVHQRALLAGKIQVPHQKHAPRKVVAKLGLGNRFAAGRLQSVAVSEDDVGVWQLDGGWDHP